MPAAGVILTVLTGAVLLLLAAAGALFRFVIVRPARPDLDFKPQKKKKQTEKEQQLWAQYHRFITARNAARPYMESLPSEHWQIKTRDGLTLSAQYFAAEEPTQKTILAVHGYHSEGINEYCPFMHFYRKLGFNVLVIDQRAHGKSEGKYIGFGYYEKEDVLCWAQQIVEKQGQNSSILLHGISMGSATVLMAGGQPQLPKQVKGIVADCAYTSAWNQFVFQIKQMFHLPWFPLLPLASGWCRVCAGYGFRQADTLACVRSICVPVLFIHGAADSYVPTEMVHTLYAACPAPKQLWLCPGAPHAQSYLVDAKTYEEKFTAFLAMVNMVKTQAV